MNSKNKPDVKSKSTKPKKLTANVPNPLPGLSIDFTEGKRADEALRESEEKHRTLYERMAQGVVYQDADGKIISANPAAERILGLSLDQMKGRPFTDPRWKAIHEDGSDFPRETHPSMVALTSGKEVYNVVMGVFNPEKEDYKWINIISIPQFTPGERVPYRVFTTLEDFTERNRAEEALRDSRNMLETVLDSIPSAVFWKDRDSIYLGGNRAWLEAAGLKSSEEVVGKSDYDLPWEKNQTDLFREHDRGVMESGIPEYDIIEPYLRADGTHSWAKTNKVPLRDKEGNILGVLGTFEDITERRQAEEALRKSEEKHRMLFETMTQGVVYQTADGKILSANSAAERILGLTLDQMKGRTSMDPRWKAIHEDGSDFPGDTHASMVALSTGKDVHDVVMGVFIPEMEDYRWINIHAVPQFRLGEAVPYQVYTVFEDITKRKQAEQEIQDLAKFPSEDPNTILRIRRDGTLLYINAAGSSQLPDWHLQVGQAAPPILKEAVVKSMKNGTMQLIDLEYGERVYSFSVAPIVATDYANLYGLDITERKQAEEALRDREGMLQKIFDILPVGLWIADKDGKLLRGNPAGVKIWGAEPKVSLSEYGVFKGRRLPSGEDIAPDDWALVHTIRDKVTIVDELLEIDAFDGRKKTILNYTAPILDAQGDVQGAIVVNQDITERKRAEEHLAYQANLLSNVNDAVTASDDRFILTAWNRAAENMFGWKSEEVLGRPGKDVFRSEFIDLDRPKVFRRVKKTGQFRGEMIQYRKDGTPIYVEANTFAMQNESGQTTGYVTISRDVTERKQAEKELAQSHEQLRALASYWQNTIEAERAHIAREIHDDFGQSMTALKMDLVWLANHLPAGDEKVDRIRGMTTLVDESVALMRRIATDLRPGLLDDLGLNAAMEWQAQEFSRHSGIPCKLNLPEHDLGLDPTLNTTLFRIFQETLTNIARHAQATRVSASLKQKLKTLVLTLRDNGRGITEGELTNPRSLGLLGLRERAAQWGGETTIHGVAGKGTKVTVRIPFPASPVIGDRR